MITDEQLEEYRELHELIARIGEATNTNYLTGLELYKLKLKAKELELLTEINSSIVKN